jgi:superkiller protein 3
LKNPTVWSNLGFLCLQSGDYEIADDAFSKAQIVSPEHSLAWMGKAMVALQRGEPHLAENLFEQAATLSGGSQVRAVH